MAGNRRFRGFFISELLISKQIFYYPIKLSYILILIDGPFYIGGMKVFMGFMASGFSQELFI